jgi:peptidoglycan/LPS O-acetylase OafA/YrhL
MSSTKRIPSLDGLRAIAIFLTVAHHMIERYGITTKNPILESFNLSGDGVGIFFVLSGFLITSLLLKEHNENGRVSLTDFYIRRTFRILPPLYAYLIFYIIFCGVEGLGVNWRAVMSAALFYLDYSPQAYFWATQHTWSLSVEEQFYLIWPLIFLLAFHLGGRPAAAKAALALIILTPVFRVVTKFLHNPIFDHRQNFMLHTRMDSLMCGCLMAILAGQPLFETLYRRIEKFWWVAPLYTLFLSGFLTLFVGFTYTNSAGLTIDSLCIAFFILWASRNPGSLVGKFLNWRIMVTAGVLSYSAYIWQTFFVWFDFHASIPAWLCTLPMRLLLICAAAYLSYRIVEKPSLRLRKAVEARIRKRRAAGISVHKRDDPATLSPREAGN